MNSELQKANDNIIISDMERELPSGSYHIFVFCLNREIEWTVKDSTLLYFYYVDFAPNVMIKHSYKQIIIYTCIWWAMNR